MGTHLININDCTTPTDTAQNFPHLMPLTLYPLKGNSMTELTEHAKTILRAIADGKTIQRQFFDDLGTWNDIDTKKVLGWLTNNALPRISSLRIKPETRSINGVEFAAPTSIRCPIVHTFSQKQLAALCEFKWVMQDSRDTAYQAIADALEGKTK